MNGFQLKRIESNDGSEIIFHDDTILIITGPNNCGKSRLLKDIFNFDQPKVVLNTVEMDFIGSMDDALFEAMQSPIMKSNQDMIYSAYNMLGLKSIHNVLRSIGLNFQLKNTLLQSLIKYITTHNRLTVIQTTQAEDPTIPFNVFALPVQLKTLYESEERESAFYEKVEKAFGRGVLLDKYTFQSNRLHFISKKDVESRDDRGTPSFASWFALQPLLDQQGDGVRSFCSVLLTVMAGTKPLILIDEPEAFLHPPQIRRLAKEIAICTPTKTQLVVSTHSTDFLQGLIDFAPGRSNVVRLTRKTEGVREVNVLRRLDSNSIASFWRDSLLKTSDVLSSLFHNIAVIVEGDSDARFLRALIDQAGENSAHENLDIRFYHCGGKQRIYKIVQSLRVIGVPVIAIVDIDILNDRTVFFSLFDAFEAPDSNVADLFDFIFRYVNDQLSTRNKGDAKQEIDDLLKDLDDRKPIPNHVVGKISEAVQSSSAWRLVKRSGQEFFTRGEPFNKFLQLQTLCRSRGLIINTLGELENFDRTVEARKEEWLAHVLTKDLAMDPDLSQARDFAAELLKLAKAIVNNH